MTKYALLAVSLLLATPGFAIAAKGAPRSKKIAESQPAEHLSEARCFDIKQSVLADLPHFCGTAKTDKVRLSDFGHQIELLSKKCEQPQLAHLLRKALDERVNNKNAQGCTAAAEKMVLSKKVSASASGEDL